MTLIKRTENKKNSNVSKWCPHTLKPFPLHTLGKTPVEVLCYLHICTIILGHI